MTDLCFLWERYLYEGEKSTKRLGDKPPSKSKVGDKSPSKYKPRVTRKLPMAMNCKKSHY